MPMCSAACCTHMRAMCRGLNCLCVGNCVMSQGSLYLPSLMYCRSLQAVHMQAVHMQATQVHCG